MKIFKVVLFLVLVYLFACNHGTEQTFKKTCIEIPVLRNGGFVTVDSCFTAPTRDSLDRLLADFKIKQAAHEEYSTKLLFVIVDTLKKKPEEYQYALVQSDAGNINPDVVLTSDLSIVKEKTDKFSPGNIIFHKLVIGEGLKPEVEAIFKNNLRINYRWESNVKLKK